jgi:HK97 family phage portal protein
MPAASGLLARLRLAAAIVMGRRPDEKLVADLFPTEKGSPPPRGTAEFLQAYGQMPWLRATVHRVAVGVASAEWKAMAVKRGGRIVHERRVQRAGFLKRRKLIDQLRKQGDLVELDTHPLIDLLHDPNPFMTGGGFRRLTEMHVDLVGEGFWLIERDGLSVPAGLWPLPPHWVRDVPSPRRPVFGLRLPHGGWEGDVPMTEIVWFVDPDPYQPYGRGVGTARSLADELETDEYAAKHTKSFFYNSARPDLMVTVKGARDPDLRAAEQRWLDRLQGFWRSFKPFFVNREVDVKEIGTTFRDMQFTQLRQHERDTIIQVFGVPPEILGVLENSNRATIEAADYLFARHVLVPRLELIRETIQERLAPMFDERLVVEYESPVQADKAHQLEAAKAQPAALVVDEWRELAGFDELKAGKGKIHLVPPTVVAVRDLIDATPPEPEPEPEPGDEPELEPGEEPEELPEGDEDGDGKALQGERRRLPSYAALPSGHGSLPVRVRAADDFLSIVQRVAGALEPRWRRRFVELVEAARRGADLGALEEALRTGNVQAVLDAFGPVRAALERQMGGSRGLRILVAVTVDAAARAGVTEIIRQLGIAISWTGANPRALAYIARHTAELVTAISEATRDAIREIVERGFREGLAPRDMARLIRHVVGLRPDQAAAVARFRGRLAAEGVAADVLERRAARYAEAQLRRRALLIARTETISAANAGQQLLWEEGLAQGQLRRERVRKIWLVTPDDRLDAKVCEPMPFLDANKDVPIEGSFTTGEGELVSHPPAHPNCRCAVALQVRR